MKIKLILILGFSLILCKGISQVDQLKESLERCVVSSIQTDIKIKFPHSENQLKLPIGWTGEFIGESPMLVARKQIGTKIFKLRVTNPWNVDTREGFENQMKEWHSNNIKLKIAGTDFFMYLDEERDQYRLIFHIDDSKEYENRWIWDFYLNIKPDADNQDLICEIKKIVIQFVETYKENN